MKNENSPRPAQAVFEEALRMPSDEARNAFLDSACRGDSAFRRRIELLLEGHFKAHGFLNTLKEEVPKPILEGPGTQIGKFKILEQIGEGGFGVVYMAEQKEPVRRRVALKIIKLGMDTKQVVARFEAERQALALMDHPNIAKVLDGGSTGSAESQISNLKSQIPAGRPYFVMELVKGRSITKFCDEERLATAQRLELFIAVCHAVQHAHQKGVVHRDLKPSNVLVSFVDGKPVPKIIDFGIAKAMQRDLTDKTVFTRFHQLMGTPAYMSPEQAGTDSADIDTRSDIYSLGAVLYELLTGRTPMDSREIANSDYDEIRRRIREVEPPRPSIRLSTLDASERTTVARSRSVEPAKLCRLVRGDLDWIVLKAMDKDRNRRYETANEFAKDLRRYLDQEPVSARKPSMAYVMQKFARRHKAGLAAAACFALLLTVSACVSTAQAIKNKSLFTAAEEARLNEMTAKEREKELRRIAETERDRSQRLLYVANMNLAKRAWDEANVGRAVELLEMHRPQAGQADLRNFEWFYLDRLCHSELLTLKGHTNAVMSVAFSPDGKRLASASGDGTVKLWDTTSGQEALTLRGHTNGVNSVAFSPDGKRLASASGDRTVKVWDATTGQETLTLKGHASGVASIAFSPDGQRLASASSDRTVKVWDALTGQELLTLKGHTNAVESVAFSPDGKRVASASYDRTVKVWDATTGQETLTFRGHKTSVYGVAFSRDGKWLASAGNDRTLKIWDRSTGKELLALKGHDNEVRGVAFSADGKRLASASLDGTVKVWDAASGQEMITLKGHTNMVLCVAFSPDGTRLASAGLGRTVKVWDAKGAQDSLTFRGHSNAVESVAFSPDGKRLASASWDSSVKVWDATSGHVSLTLIRQSNGVTCATFSPDGKRLASASGDFGKPGEVKVLDATSGEELLTLKGHSDQVWGVAFSPDGKLLASAGLDSRNRMGPPNRPKKPGEVKVWDATTGQEKLTLKGHASGVTSIAFSPDGRRLASASDDRTVKVWDAMTGQETLALKGHNSSVDSVAFSPDGKWLASASGDKTVKLWDATTGQETLALRGHNAYVQSVAFSPDGKRLASASGDKTVKLWDATTGQETFTLKGHSDQVWGVAFSPDGKRLASASLDGTVKVWDARPRAEASAPDAKTR